MAKIVNKAKIKKKLRLDVKHKRRSLPPALRQHYSLDLVSTNIDKLTDWIKKFSIKEIGGYWPIFSEIDPRPIMVELERRGCHLSLPVVSGSGTMVFKRFNLDDCEKLCPDAMGILGPELNSDVVHPDLILVPVCGFDLNGHRLGYGVGFYDRYLAKQSNQKDPFLVGLAFSIQKVKDIPVEAHDRHLDALLTEKKVYCFCRSLC